MIVDLHTRVWETAEQLGRGVAERIRRLRNEPWEHPNASADALEEAMGTVDAAVVLGFESQLLDARISHEDVAKVVARQPGKFVGFAGIDPLSEDALESLDQAVELGLRGVTVNPALQGMHPAATRAMALFEACEARGLPVLVESAALAPREAMLEFAAPVLLDEVARSFPDLQIVIGSIGDPYFNQTIALLAKHPTVYANIAGAVNRPWQLLNVLIDAYQRGVIGQLLFGSGFPFCTPEQAIMTLYSMYTITQGTPLPSVPREQLRSIVERDSLLTLGIAFESTGRSKPSVKPVTDEAEPQPAAASAEAESAATTEGEGEAQSETTEESSASREQTG